MHQIQQITAVDLWLKHTLSAIALLGCDKYICNNGIMFVGSGASGGGIDFSVLHACCILHPVLHCSTSINLSMEYFLYYKKNE